MSSSPRLANALKVLKEAGRRIGAGHVRGGGEMLVPIDDVPKSFEEIYELAAEEDRKPRKATRTGEYFRFKVAPRTRRGTLGEAINENGHFEYLFKLDERFDVSGSSRRPFYVPETDIDPCKRPTDEEVDTINKLVDYGDKP